MSKEDNTPTLELIGVTNTESTRLIVKISYQSISYVLQSDSCFVGNTIAISNDSKGLTCREVEDALYGTPLPGHDFKSVSVIIESSHFLVVPSEVAEGCNNDKLLEAAFGKMEIEQAIECDAVPSADAAVVWSMDADIHNFMLRTFYNATFSHTMTPVIMHGMKRALLANTPRMLIVADSDIIKVVVANSNKLCAANMYHCTSIDNAVYYLMALWNECRLDQLTAEVLVAGTWDKRSQLEQALREYVKIVLPEIYSPALLKISKDTQTYPFDIMLKLINIIYANN